MSNDLITVVIAAGGWIVAVITLAIGYVERKSAREEERLAKTLDYFDGGSQRRSIGISLLEGVWLHKRQYHSILVPLIANQIVYLLLSTNSHDAYNERNLIRLLTIFEAIPGLKNKYHDRWADVCDAISRKHDGQSKGMPVSKSTLALWAKALGHAVDA